MGVAVDEVGRDHAGLEAFLRAVEVGKEGVERVHPLRQAALHRRPFRLGQDARDDVEGDQALGRFVVAVNGEGDADAAEEQLRLAAAGVEHVGGRRVEPSLEAFVGGAGRGSVGRLPVHLVERPPDHPSPPIRHPGSNRRGKHRSREEFAALVQSLNGGRLWRRRST
jgi:hypothetical protein